MLCYVLYMYLQRLNPPPVHISVKDFVDETVCVGRWYALKCRAAADGHIGGGANRIGYVLEVVVGWERH